MNWSKARRRSGALACLLILVGCGGGGATATATADSPSGAATTAANTGATVDIRDIAFKPRSVSVHTGQAVTWKFDDGSIPHNVAGGGWRSPDRTSGSYSHTFTVPGTYAYRCTIHSSMTGQVVVTA